MLCAVRIGGLDLLRRFYSSQSTSKFFLFSIAKFFFLFNCLSRDEHSFLNWQFSRELPTPVRACALVSKSSHALGDGQI
jgi:hypothetical protein